MNVIARIDNIIRRCFLKWYELFPPPLDEGSQCSAKYLIIRRCAGDACGLFSIYTSVLSWLIYAETQELIPIIDLKTYLNPYLEWWEVGRKNAWDFYFDQLPPPNVLNLDCAKIVHGGAAPNIPSFYDILDDDDAIQKWRSIAAKYIPLKVDVLDAYTNDDLDAALTSGVVVGILARGTDHIKLHFPDHYIQPTAEQLIAQADTFLDQLPQSTKVYLVTEDISIYQKIKVHYGEKLILSRQKLFEYHDGPIAACVSRPGKRRKQGASYLKAIYDLSRCQYLVAGRNNGMKAAMILSRGFKGSYIYNLGTYSELNSSN